MKINLLRQKTGLVQNDYTSAELMYKDADAATAGHGLPLIATGMGSQIRQMAVRR